MGGVVVGVGPDGVARLLMLWFLRVHIECSSSDNDALHARLTVVKFYTRKYNKDI